MMMRKPIKPFFVEHRSRKPSRRDELVQEVWPDDVPVRQVREDYDYDSAIAAAEAVFSKIPAATTPVYASKRPIQTYDEQPDMSALFEQPSGISVPVLSDSLPEASPVASSPSVEEVVDTPPADAPAPSGNPRILPDMTYVSEVEQRLAAPKRRGRPRKVVQELPLPLPSEPAELAIGVTDDPVVPVSSSAHIEEVTAGAEEPISVVADVVVPAETNAGVSEDDESDEFDDDEFEDDEFVDNGGEVTEEEKTVEKVQIRGSGRKRRGDPIPETYYKGLSKKTNPEEVIDHIRSLNNGDYVPLRTYCKVLNDLEIPTVRGGVWAPQTVANLIVRIEREKRLSRSKVAAPPSLAHSDQPRRGRPRKEPTVSLEPKYVYKVRTFKDEGLTKLIHRKAPKPGQKWGDRIKIIRGR